MFAKDIMKKNSIVCTEEMSLFKVYQLMQDNECEFIPVVENYAHKNPIGVVTEHDICQQIVGKSRHPRGLTVANVMNTQITKTLETSLISHCADLLKDSKTKRLFVVDENGSFCGTLTRKEIDASRSDRRMESLNRSAFFSEYTNVGINRIF